MDEPRKKRKNKPGGGGPTVLTPELQDKICGYLEIGAPITTACAACGIHRATYYQWLDQIEKGKMQLGHPLKDHLKEFAVKVEAAKAKFEIDNLQMIRAFADGSKGKGCGNWFAAAWALERVLPDGYSLVSRNKTTVDQTISVKDALADAEKLI